MIIQCAVADITELKASTKADIKEMATKADIKELKAEIAEVKAEIAELRTETKAEIAELRTETKAEIAELKVKLVAVQWLLGLLFVINVAIFAKLSF